MEFTKDNKELCVLGRLFLVLVYPAQAYTVKILIYTGVILSLLGCSNAAYSPYPDDTRLPYPSHSSLSVQRLPPLGFVPTPFPGKSTIIGRLYNAATGKPVSGVSLYLADILPLTPAPNFFITLDPMNSLRAPLLADGSFIMANITPGKHALILWTPQRATYVSNSEDEVLIVDAIADQIIDLGKLTIVVP